MKKQTNQEKNIIKNISMDCVYAPPELIGKTQLLDNEAVYPSIHSADSEAIVPEHDDQGEMMGDVYGSPKMMRGTAGKKDIDPDETVQFCRNCGQPIPMSERFCPYCGEHTKASRIEERRIEAPPMACVYASPERMGRIESKPKAQNQRREQERADEYKGLLSRILSRIFRRKH